MHVLCNIQYKRRNCKGINLVISGVESAGGNPKSIIINILHPYTYIYTYIYAHFIK